MWGLVFAVGLAGCGRSGDEYHPVQKGVKVQDPPHEHEHGPHGGHLVELGEEEYHAEVVFQDKTGKITVYLLDSSAKKPNPIDAKQVTLKLTVGGKPQDFSAAAVPDAGDPQGKSSRFELADNADIKAHIKDEEDLQGTVDVTIGKKAYSGQIKHEHEH